MHQVELLTPTERELRGVTGDFEKSLPSVAATVMSALRVANLIVTMGPRGAVLFRPRELTETWFVSAWGVHSQLAAFFAALLGVSPSPLAAVDYRFLFGDWRARFCHFCI